MIARRLALVIALIAGLIGSQGPEFAQQYRQRIGGALDELERIVAAFDAEAAHEELTPPQAIGRLEQDHDPLAREHGHDMASSGGADCIAASCSSSRAATHLFALPFRRSRARARASPAR